MFGIGLPELILILVVALLVLGPKRLPEAARSIGRGYREFQKAVSGIKSEVDKAGEAAKGFKEEVESSVTSDAADSEPKKDETPKGD